MKPITPAPTANSPNSAIICGLAGFFSDDKNAVSPSPDISGDSSGVCGCSVSWSELKFMAGFLSLCRSVAALAV